VTPHTIPSDGPVPFRTVGPKPLPARGPVRTTRDPTGMHSAGCCCPGCYSLVDYLEEQGKNTHGLVAVPPAQHDPVAADTAVHAIFTRGAAAGFKVLASLKRRRTLTVAAHAGTPRPRKTCHGYANGCVCEPCHRQAVFAELARQAGVAAQGLPALPASRQPEQPWEPRPSRHDAARKRAA
jgi:hypothetical protein